MRSSVSDFLKHVYRARVSFRPKLRAKSMKLAVAQRTGSCLLISLMVLVLSGSGCTDLTSAEINEELRPLWIVNSDHSLGSVQVYGRIAEQRDNVYDIRGAYEKLIQGQPVSAWLGTNLALDSFGFDDGVRLVGRDRMRAIDARGVYQLRRREALFNYRTSFPLNPSASELELRLDYAGNRFGASTTFIRYIDLNSVTLVEEGQSLTPVDSINLSWNIGDLELPASSELIQRVRLKLEACSGVAFSDTELVLSAPLEDRSATIAINRFPSPESGLTGTCRFSVQVMAAVLPTILLSSDVDTVDDTQGSELSPVPITVVLIQSETKELQVIYGN